MLTARIVGNNPTAGAAGVGQITASFAAAVNAGPNPNQALDQYVGADPNGGSLPVFDATSWSTAAQANPNWNSSTYSNQSWSLAAWQDAAWQDAAWQDAAWQDAAWQNAAWQDAAWQDAAWQDAAWQDAAWQDAAWQDAAWQDESSTDVSQEDVAAGDTANGTVGYAATRRQRSLLPPPTRCSPSFT